MMSGFFLSKALNRVPRFKQFCRGASRRIMSGDLISALLRRLAKAGLLPLFIWRWLPVERDFVVSLSPRHKFFYRSTFGDLIGRFLYWSGTRRWERRERLVFYDLARTADLVLDIGANTGVYTLTACAANPSARVIAFEPEPRAFERLSDNIALNGWESRCEARREAASDFVGRSEFEIPSHSRLPTSSRLRPDRGGRIEGDLTTVPLTTVDTVCDGKGRVGLVKIDVEGAEGKVLDGMRTVLEQSAPTILMETRNESPLRKIQDTLTRAGYRLFDVRDEGLAQISEIAADGERDYWNLLCVPERESELIERLQRNHGIASAARRSVGEGSRA